MMVLPEQERARQKNFKIFVITWVILALVCLGCMMLTYTTYWAICSSTNFGLFKMTKPIPVMFQTKTNETSANMKRYRFLLNSVRIQLNEEDPINMPGIPYAEQNHLLWATSFSGEWFGFFAIIFNGLWILSLLISLCFSTNKNQTLFARGFASIFVAAFAFCAEFSGNYYLLNFPYFPGYPWYIAQWHCIQGIAPIMIVIAGIIGCCYLCCCGCCYPGYGKVVHRGMIASSPSQVYPFQPYDRGIYQQGQMVQPQMVQPQQGQMVQPQQGQMVQPQMVQHQQGTFGEASAPTFGEASAPDLEPGTT